MADIVVILTVILSAAVAMILPVFFSRGTPSYAEIVCDEGSFKLALDKDASRSFVSGECHVTVIIESGAVSVVSDCKQGFCMQKKISASGESIICAPARMIITIIGSDSGKEGEPEYVVAG